MWRVGGVGCVGFWLETKLKYGFGVVLLFFVEEGAHIGVGRCWDLMCGEKKLDMLEE